MTGLETILQQILQDAEQEANALLADAEEKKASVLAEAKQAADAAAKAKLELGEQKAQQIRERAESAAQMERRNAMLSFKQNLISETITKVKQEMENAPDAEYFSILLALADRFAIEGTAQLRLNARDLARLPADFAEQLKQTVPQTEITICKEPLDIQSGFLLVYEGIDINCTLDAVFDGDYAQLSDAVNRILWKVSA